nr:hypothetical protein [Tanacetum cinerariifolium]
AANDQPIADASQHPERFQQQKEPPTPNHTLTPELPVGLTYELMKGSCKSFVELEFFLEEVYKVTTDQLDWNNPKGQQYPHNLLNPLSLIPNSRVCHVIPFDHFINNELEYLRGGASSRKYTTSVTKTKAADYGHIKEGKEQESTSGLKEKATRTTGKSTQGSSSQQKTKSESVPAEEPMQTAKDLEEPSHQEFKTGAADDQPIAEASQHLEWKTDKSDSRKTLCFQRLSKNAHKKHRHPKACERPSTSDGMLNDVRTALDDRLKGIRMKYLP